MRATSDTLPLLQRFIRTQQRNITLYVVKFTDNTEAELLHTYSKVDLLDTLILCVRLAVLVAVTLTVPVVLFPVSTLQHRHTHLATLASLY